MHIWIVKMRPPWISILSSCVGLDKVMHNGTITLGIQELCVGPNIKLNQKSIYVCIHMHPLSTCIFRFVYISGQHWKKHNIFFPSTTQCSSINAQEHSHFLVLI